MRKQFLFLLTFLFTFLTFIFSTEVQATPLENAKAIIENIYVGEVNGDIEKANTIDQLVQMLDPYSEHYTYEEFIELQNTINQTSFGVGIVVEQAEDGILIVNVI